MSKIKRQIGRAIRQNEDLMKFAFRTSIHNFFFMESPLMKYFRLMPIRAYKRLYRNHLIRKGRIKK